MSFLDEREDLPVRAVEKEESEEEEDSQGAYQMIQQAEGPSSDEENDSGKEEKEEEIRSKKDRDSIPDSKLDDLPTDQAKEEDKKEENENEEEEKGDEDNASTTSLNQVGDTQPPYSALDNEKDSKPKSIIPPPLLPPPGASPHSITTSPQEIAEEDDQGHEEDEFNDFTTHALDKESEKTREEEEEEEFDDFAGFDDGENDEFGMGEEGEDPFGDTISPSSEMSRNPSEEGEQGGDQPPAMHLDLPDPLDFTQPWNTLEIQWKHVNSKYLFPSTSTMTPSASTETQREDGLGRDQVSESDPSDPTHTLLEAAMTPREERVFRWKRSRLRQCLLISLGIPVNLDEVNQPALDPLLLSRWTHS